MIDFRTKHGDCSKVSVEDALAYFKLLTDKDVVLKPAVAFFRSAEQAGCLPSETECIKQSLKQLSDEKDKNLDPIRGNVEVALFNGLFSNGVSLKMKVSMRDLK